MPSKISKYNLDKDKNVLGKEWLSAYGGWFSDEENIQSFINAVKPLLPKKSLDILYVASASGLLGEKLLLDLGKGCLTIVDISQKHLDENVNPKTTKIKTDLLEMDLGKRFDLIIMRSSLDYLPSKSLQVKVLKIIRNHLNPNGLFVNQPAYISNLEDRDIISKAYNDINKIGKRLFQSTDLDSIYLDAGFEIPKKIGKGKEMTITEKDHQKRYEINQKEIKLIQEIIKNSKNSAKTTKEGYILKFEFPIFISKAL